MKNNKNIRICLYCKPYFVLFGCLLTFIYPTLSPAETNNLTIATQNAYNFFNDENDGKSEKILSTKNYQLRLKRLTQYVVKTLNAPDIIAFQEIENFKTLNDLKVKLSTTYQLCYQVALLNGHKKVAINVGFLINCDYKIKNISQLFKSIKLKSTNKFLYTRPPLYLNVCKKEHCFHIVNVHLRSMLGLKKRKKTRYVQHKRFEQAQHLAKWINQFQLKNIKGKLIILGDFNALNVSDEYVDVLGIIKGTPSNVTKRLISEDLVENNLLDLTLQIPLKQRFSYRYKKKQQILDYILVSKNLVTDLESIKFSQINYKVSDHAGLVATFKLPQK
ncbi:MAG: endonuclease/exonuclease/phosphatase family protein [Gammaproteobacteria bacterium]|nr:endonuclease/exonuclease/phosphatase family protein [Gammaproteobacteria bacterium]